MKSAPRFIELEVWEIALFRPTKMVERSLVPKPAGHAEEGQCPHLCKYKEHMSI